MPIRHLLKEKYWFRPYRWGEVAVYYPIRFPGFVVSGFSLFFLSYFLAEATVAATSFGSFLFMFIPKALVVLLVFDLFCFRTGEYPTWWRHHTWHKHESWVKRSH